MIPGANTFVCKESNEGCQQELVFMGERCTDDKALQDYGICHKFIKQVRGLADNMPVKRSRSAEQGCMPQVTGFTVNPSTPGRRFVKGRLVPFDT